MQKYKLINKLSSGAFGTVYNAEAVAGPAKGQQVAIKQVYMSDLVKRELQILVQLKPHPNIVGCLEIVEQNKFQRSIVMQRGVFDLDQLIESMEYPIDQNIVRVVAKGLLLGLQQLHSQGFIHRDLKPSNIVVKQSLETVAICDFGSAVQCTKGQQYMIEGFTRWYKPPEMLFGSRTYKYEVDVWSLGCILVELATGEQLFPGKSELEQIALISNLIGDPSVKNWPSAAKFHDFGKINFAEKAPKSKEEICRELGLSPELCSFVMRMLRYEDRASVEELLSDEYLVGIKPGFQLGLGIFGTEKVEPKIIR